MLQSHEIQEQMKNKAFSTSINVEKVISHF